MYDTKKLNIILITGMGGLLVGFYLHWSVGLLLMLVGFYIGFKVTSTMHISNSDNGGQNVSQALPYAKMEYSGYLSKLPNCPSQAPGDPSFYSGETMHQTPLGMPGYYHGVPTVIDDWLDRHGSYTLSQKKAIVKIIKDFFSEHGNYEYAHWNPSVVRDIERELENLSSI